MNTRMVKTLQDCCLTCIARHISSYNRLGNYLSLKHKQILLERLCWHNFLTPANTPSIIYHFISHTLQRVNLSYSEQVDDKILGLLGESGCLLLSIVIQECPHVTDKGISSLRRVLRKSEEIKFKNLKLITGKGLKAIKSRTVWDVNLKRCHNIEDDGIITLVKNCPNIKKLNLCELHRVTDKAFMHIAEVLNDNLVELNSCEMNVVTSQSTTSLAQHCKNLSIVDFESCVRLDGSGLCQMAERCNLSSLCISFCYKVPPQACEIIISLLRAKGNLLKFRAFGLIVSPLALEMISSTDSLTSLNLCGVSTVTDKMLEMIVKDTGKRLIEFDVSNCTSLTDQSCTSISRHCTALEVLGLRNLRGITGQGLSNFFTDKDNRAKNFRIITLSGSKFFSNSVVGTIVTNSPNLEYITLAGVLNIGNEIPEAISLHCIRIKRLSFRNCNLTDEGVCKLVVSCSELVMIALAGIHDLTDKSIVALAENCPGLRELYISGCAKITKQAVTYLKDCAVGRVLVIHSTPQTPTGLLMAKDLDTGKYCRVDDFDFDTVSG